MELFFRKLDSLSNLGISFSAGKHIYTTDDLNQYKMSFLELNKSKEVTAHLQSLNAGKMLSSKESIILDQRLDPN